MLRSSPLLFAALAFATTAGAQPAPDAPFEHRARVATRPAFSLVVRANEGRTRVELGRTTRDLPGAPEAVRTEVVRIGRHAIAKIEIDAGTRRHVLLVRGARAPEVLFEGRLDLHGDRGERRRDLVLVEDRTGDGQDDLIVAQADEARTLCGVSAAGEAPTLLSVRALDPRSGTLQPVTLRRLPEVEGERAIPATSAAPHEDLADPLVRALAVASTSSSAGAGTEFAPPPLALVDQDPATDWVEGHPGDGAWEFVTARWTAPDLPLRALALQRSARPEVAWPAEVFVLHDGGRLRVALPADTAPGARAFVELPQPLATRCLAVIVAPFEGEGGGHVGFAALDAYTEVDFGGGLEALMARLAGGGERGAIAARVLARVGPEVLAPLLARWPDMPPAERILATDVFLAQLPNVDAREAVLRAATDADERVRAHAIEGAETRGAKDVLAELVAVPGGPGDDAALRLARLAPREAAAPILAAIAGPDERPVLRRALRQAYEQGAPASLILGWLQQAPVRARAHAALGLASSDAAPALEVARTLVAGTVEHALDFPERWRLLRAVEHLGVGANTRAFVRTQTEAEEWMMRASALEVFARCEDCADAARERARALLRDETPRVRVAAIEALAQLGLEGREVEAVATLGRRDDWPRVRAAGIRALARTERALPVVRAAMTDPSRRVRAAAIRTATEAGDGGAWERIRARIEDDGEWPEVVSAGIAHVRATCRRDAVETLEVVVQRALRPDAWAPDLDVAGQAIVALLAIGTDDALAIVRHANREGAPPAIRMAAEGADSVERCAP